MKHLWRAGILILVCIISGCLKGPLHFDVFRIKANPGKFECYINGRDFVPDSNQLHLISDGPPGPVITYVENFNNDSYDVIIEAGGSIDLSVQHVTGTGVYEFNTPEHQEADYYDYPPRTSYAQPPAQAIYRLYTPGHGSLTLTRFDVKNQVIAGTFWFNAVNEQNPLDSVKVTGGHFNIADAIFR
jgi:hypothetical protein